MNGRKHNPTQKLMNLRVGNKYDGAIKSRTYQHRNIDIECNINRM